MVELRGREFRLPVYARLLLVLAAVACGEGTGAAVPGQEDAGGTGGAGAGGGSGGTAGEGGSGGAGSVACPTPPEESEEQRRCREAGFIFTRHDDGTTDCVPPVRVSSEAECLQAGGIPLYYDFARTAYAGCALKTADGGVPCQDSATCVGYCAAPTGARAGAAACGVCSAQTIDTCMQTVKDGVVAPLLCLDP